MSNLSANKQDSMWQKEKLKLTHEKRDYNNWRRPGWVITFYLFIKKGI